jgi:uridine phosphorylase
VLIGGSLKSRPVSQPEPAHPADPADPPAPSAIHLHPTAELAERVLLPGDPGRALALAQVLIAEPRMFNHHRGLWGYTGPARADGEPLTIQSTGMGGPSAAIVLHELISLGARRAIRVGTCGALHPDLALGDLVIARESICLDGASRALGAAGRWPIGDPVDLRSVGDPGLTDALIRAAPHAHSGTIVSVDLFYDGSRLPDTASDALVIEMEAATLFAVGARAEIPVGCVLAVSDTFDAHGARTHIDDHLLLAAAESMGAVAAAALGAARLN